VLELVAVILAPAAFWLVYHYFKDRDRPEPLALLLTTYVAGIAAGALCLGAFERLNGLGLRAEPEDGAVPFFLYCVLVVGLVEESAKLAPVWLLCMRWRHFDEPVDGMVYASVAALGFASFENYQYMQFLDGAPMLARAVASPLTHAVFASMWGYALGRARYAGAPAWRSVIPALLCAALAHGVYDFVAVGAHVAFRPVTAVIVLALWIWRMRAFRRLQAGPG